MTSATMLVRARSALLCVAAVAASALPSSVQAQEAASREEPDVPREFARVLLDLTPGGEFLIGRAPESLPGGAVLVADARVIGSVVYRNRSRVGLAVPEPVAEARPRFESRLRAAGWAEAPSARGAQHGFLPAYAEDRFRFFCWPATDARLSMTVQPAPAGGSYIVLHYNAPADGSPCSAAPPSETGMYRGIAALLPTLRLPDGASFSPASGGSSSSGGMEAETRALVTTELSPAQLIAHFEPQLRADGWAAVEQVHGAAMAVQHARKPHETGALQLWVAAYRVNPEELSLSMRIARAR